MPKYPIPASYTALALSLVFAVLVGAFAGLAWAQPSDTERLYQQAEQSLAQGKFQEAVENFRAILGPFPNDLRALNGLGVALVQQREYKQAIEVYRKALAIDPRAPGLTLTLVWLTSKWGISAPPCRP
jgi:tetratricopeptide (TPR) repeat protein